MSLIDTIIFGFILFLPFFLLVILPTILSYIYGNKSLEKTKLLYTSTIKHAAKKLLREPKLSIKEIDKLNRAYILSGDLDITVELGLVERRTYAYYFAKIFGGIPDAVFLKINLNKMPPAILYMVSKKRKRLIEKSQKYIYALDELNLGQLNNYFITLSDNPRFALKYFDKKIITLITKLKDHLSYVIVDYKSPQIEISMQLKDKEVNMVHDLMLLGTQLAKSVTKVKGKGKETDVLAFVRKALREK